LRVHGWQQPGIPGLTFPGYAAVWEAEGYDWSTEYPQVVMGRYPLVEMGGNGAGNKYRWLPTGPGYDMPHFSMDSMTGATAIAGIDKAIGSGFSVELMHHPKYVVAGTATLDVAGLTAVLDHVVALRDAGTVEVLTASGMAFADPTTARRLNILRNGDFASGFFTDWTTIGAGVTSGAEGSIKYANFPDGATDRTLGQVLSDGTVRALGLQGTTMQVKARVKVVGSVAAPLRFEIRDSSNTANLFQLRTTTHPAGDWRTVTFPFTLHPDTTALGLEFFRNAGGDGSDVYLADVKIEPV